MNYYAFDAIFLIDLPYRERSKPIMLNQKVYLLHTFISKCTILSLFEKCKKVILLCLSKYSLWQQYQRQVSMTWLCRVKNYDPRLFHHSKSIDLAYSYIKYNGFIFLELVDHKQFYCSVNRYKKMWYWC